MRQSAGSASIHAGQGGRVRTSLNEPGESAPTLLVELENVPSGTFAEAEAVIDGESESLILYREGDAVRAWLNICPHAGRRLDFAPGQFLKSRDGLLVCAAHGATFETTHGECTAGPCRGQSLRSIAVAVRDGKVWHEASAAG